MNRRRHETRSHASVFLSVVSAVAVMAIGGICHAYYKNQQIRITREIDAIERRVEQYNLDIRTIEMRSDQLLNRFVIRKQIEENSSQLRPIPLDVIEEIDPSSIGRQNVAAAAP